MEPPETPSEKPKRDSNAAPPLENLGDVQRALARLAHRVSRFKMPLAKAAELRAIYVALANVMADRRDSRWVARAKKLWQQYSEGNEKPVAPNAVPSTNH